MELGGNKNPPRMHEEGATEARKSKHKTTKYLFVFISYHSLIYQIQNKLKWAFPGVTAESSNHHQGYLRLM